MNIGRVNWGIPELAWQRERRLFLCNLSEQALWKGGLLLFLHVHSLKIFIVLL